MIWFAGKKFLGLLATLVVAAAIVFVVLDIVSLDHSGQSGVERFLRWFGGMFIGDFGRSASLGEPVGSLIAGRLAVTLPLALLSLILAIAIGGLAGIGAARRPNSVWAKILIAVARLCAAIPEFWLGMLLVLLFSMTLRWLPQGGFVPWQDNPLGALQSLILPSLALAIPLAALLAQMAHQTLADARASDFVRAAEARGLTRSDAMRQHGLPNAALGLLSLAGLAVASLFAATMIVENVFYLPGLGRLILDGVGARDLVLVRGGLAVLILLTAGTLFLLDLLRAWVDPQLRAEKLP